MRISDWSSDVCSSDLSSYITLEHLAAMTREGRDFKVVDAKTDADITHNVLTQIIMEEEARGTSMLPVNFLRQLIAMYGDSMQAMVPGYLDASMDSFRRNQEQFKSARSEERRVGKECVSTCRCRGSP